MHDECHEAVSLAQQEARRKRRHSAIEGSETRSISSGARWRPNPCRLAAVQPVPASVCSASSLANARRALTMPL